MHKISQFVAVALCAGILASSAPAHAEKWKAVGTRWAERTDEAGKVLAMYDLSYPTLRKRLKIATIQFSRLDARAAVETLRMSGDPRALKLLESVDESQLDGVGRAPDRWWTSIPWKDRGLSAASEAPQAFALSQIDLERAAAKPAHLRKLLKKLARAVLDSDEGPLLGDDFLSRIEFRRAEGGDAYDVYWQPPVARSAAAEHGKKVMDLLEPDSGLEQAVAWDAVQKLLGLAIDQIDVPWVQSLLGEAVSLFFQYRQQIARNHSEMAIEMLTLAKDPGSRVHRTADANPFASLLPADLNVGAKSVFLSESTIFSVLRWIVLRPVKTWLKDIGQWNKTAQDALDWMTAHGFVVDNIGSHFAVGVQGSTGPKFLFALSRPRVTLDVQHPFHAVDYQNPEKLKLERIAMEAAAVAGDFALRFIPTVGGSLASIYMDMMQKSMKDSMQWESRLAATLWELASGGENWDTELTILEQQLLNPLEIPRDQALSLVRERRRALGLR